MSMENHSLTAMVFPCSPVEPCVGNRIGTPTPTLILKKVQNRDLNLALRVATVRVTRFLKLVTHAANPQHRSLGATNPLAESPGAANPQVERRGGANPLVESPGAANPLVESPGVCQSMMDATTLVGRRLRSGHGLTRRGARQPSVKSWCVLRTASIRLCTADPRHSFVLIFDIETISNQVQQIGRWAWSR